MRDSGFCQYCRKPTSICACDEQSAEARAIIELAKTNVALAEQRLAAPTVHLSSFHYGIARRGINIYRKP